MLRTMATLGMILFAACGDSRCSLKPNPGLCSALIDGYFFDAKKGQCASFEWGGCDDGVRPFKSLAECEAACE